MMNPHDPRTWPTLADKAKALRAQVEEAAWTGQDTRAMEAALAATKTKVRNGEIYDVPF